MSSNIPTVTICCITYKHEKYIRECLNGFIMQKTNFPFEVIVHDDASPDKTADIIREYEARYPDIIKPIYQTQNQRSLGKKVSLTYVYPKVRSKYIAICEGDDFWCDPNKLQMQYDFMEAHPDYSLCMHGFKRLDYFARTYSNVPFIKNFPENGMEFARRTALGEYLYSTQTMFIRKSVFDAKHDEIYRDSQFAPMSDTQIAFHLALAGNVKYIRSHMAVYRVNPGSVTNTASGRSKDFDERANTAVNNMLTASGHSDWAEERQQLKSKWAAEADADDPNILQKIWRKIIHYRPCLAARIRFLQYMAAHSK